jgi:hypothetical protein
MKPRIVIQLLLCIASLFASAFATDAKPEINDRKREKALRENDRNAEQAMARDMKLYNNREFRELETDYQAASARFREADAKTTLEAFLKKWAKGGNRVGCATLYLAQRSSGDDRERLLRECMTKHDECYYLNGARVGGLARLYLMSHLMGSGKADEAAKVRAEIEAKYALCNDHSGHLLIEVLQADKP